MITNEEFIKELEAHKKTTLIFGGNRRGFANNNYSVVPHIATAIIVPEKYLKEAISFLSNKELNLYTNYWNGFGYTTFCEDTMFLRDCSRGCAFYFVKDDDNSQWLYQGYDWLEKDNPPKLTWLDDLDYFWWYDIGKNNNNEISDEDLFGFISN